MINQNIITKKISFIFTITFVILILTNSMTLSPFYFKEKALAFDEDEFIHYITFENQSNNINIVGANTSQSQIQIPDTAKGPQVPEKGYWIKEIGDSLYAVSDGSYNTMFLVTEQGVMVVDAPPTIGKRYLDAISEITNKTISHIIYSHAHIDHIGAAGIFPTNATVIAHEETAKELVRATDVATNKTMIPPIPDVTFSDNMTLSVGNKTLELDYHGINHSPGNIFIYAPQQKVLMFVDVIFPGWIPFPYLALAKDTAGFIEAHDTILNRYNFSTLVAGHLTRLGTTEDVIVQKEFVSDLMDAAANANNKVAFSEIAKQVGSSFDNPWLIFSKYIEAVNQECVNQMLPKWENKLGGAKIFMDTHCFAMAEDGRVNPTVMALLHNSTFVYR